MQRHSTGAMLAALLLIYQRGQSRCNRATGKMEEMAAASSTCTFPCASHGLIEPAV